MAAGAFAARRLPPWSNGWQRGRPERALYVAAGLGWVVLVLHQVVASLGVPLTDAVVGFELGFAHGSQASGPTSTGLAAAVHAVMWVAMIAAMTLPTIGGSVRFVALRCPRRLRRAAMIDVLAGWVAAWSAAAVVLAGAAWWLVHGAGLLPAAVTAFLVAAAWQLTARKRISLARCHRTMAPPLERRAAREACRRFGLGLGAECALSCGALMLPMAVLHHHLLAVVPLTAVSWYERARPHAEVRQRETASVVAAVGLATVVALAVA